LETLFSSYPLKLLPLAYNHGDTRCIQLFMIGHGGGLVSGDAIKLRLTLENDCILVLKTQGSTKVYRASALHESASQEVTATLCHDSLLVSVPDPVTCFKDSQMLQSQVYHLSEKASCVIVDSFTSGRACNGEMWEASRISNKLQLFVDDKLVFIENLDLQSKSGLTISERIGNCGIFGTVLLVGPRTLSLRNELSFMKERRSFRAYKSTLLQQQSGRERETGLLVSIADIPGGIYGSILRFSADTTEEAYGFLADLLKNFAADIKLSPSPFVDRVPFKSCFDEDPQAV
jgi:urease accessory protein